ncbi:EscJ/YscJ/HrcJ family type III secretion inner membrane ring protein [Pseudomonas sp. PA15(2017)]|uniref:type III secretion system inner membrane ring lipoprotein SctJ n=1 Tax=Pseudomonas sp. PA15(2017) TaxID=1932111 RepID=UPI00095DA297|nr:type III secretion inner membrane ring lipoprotein SctJ [Pseudomonas sp. PA15(2017)]OLU33672.1 EscJ/YscJ/HrcJ family type III secretion inner membrane ring protein [Pseudomonas sp. PA15(2017)]
MKKRLALWFCVLMLVGCSEQTDLFSGLSEQDANDVIASLGDYRIDTGKRTEKSGIVVSVDRADTNRAIRILESAGLPRRARTSIGEIFKKEGVISTPLEERARYIYALSQELESTLSQIDGVIVARVHVVLPERVAPGEPVQPASAAVFIKHSQRLEPDAVRQRIQMMVSSSIPGMADTVSVDSGKFSIVFVPAAAFDDAEPLVKFGPFLLEEHQLGFWQRVLWGAPAVLILLLLIIALVARADWRQALFSRFAPRRSTTLPSRT